MYVLASCAELTMNVTSYGVTTPAIENDPSVPEVTAALPGIMTAAPAIGAPPKSLTNPFTVIVDPPGTVMLMVRVLTSGLSPAEGDASEIVTDVLPLPTAAMRTVSLLMVAVATLAFGAVVMVYGGVPPVSFADDAVPGVIVTELPGKAEVKPLPPGGAVVSSLLHPPTSRRRPNRPRHMCCILIATSMVFCERPVEKIWLWKTTLSFR